MATLGDWVQGARPRTLPAAIAPVAAGTGAAAWIGSVVPGRALLALLVAVALQVGVNYANDYSDGIRGTDRSRVGPVRLVGQGRATPAAVRAAALATFAVAAVAGLALTALAGAWWLLAVGAASIAAAWLYTGGPRPYGYAGLGEVFVFAFFGLVPTVGTAYVQVIGAADAGRALVAAAIASVGVGALACAILVANNLRDIPTDTAAGKRTLAVRLGDARTRQVFVTAYAVPVVATVVLTALTTPWALLGLLATAPGLRPLMVVSHGATGRDLVQVLKDTGLVLLAYGLLTGAGLALGAA